MFYLVGSGSEFLFFFSRVGSGSSQFQPRSATLFVGISTFRALGVEGRPGFKTCFPEAWTSWEIGEQENRIKSLKDYFFLRKIDLKFISVKTLVKPQRQDPYKYVQSTSVSKIVWPCIFTLMNPFTNRFPSPKKSQGLFLSEKTVLLNTYFRGPKGPGTPDSSPLVRGLKGQWA